MASTVQWPGKFGKDYEYQVFELPVNFESGFGAGNYIFAKISPQSQWMPVYIGQTGDLSERFDEHPARLCIRRNGATHIHAHRNPNQGSQLAEELDLLVAWNPTCNKHQAKESQIVNVQNK